MINNCPRCGASNPIYVPKNKVYYCESCGAVVPEQVESNDEIFALKVRANRCFLNCDFEAAKNLYQSFVVKNPDDSEGYWMLALCEYGVQFVDEIVNGIDRKVPTCHRANHKSIFENSDYIKACSLANVIIKKNYQDFAQKIDRIQKGILALSEKEESFDVFICYKQSDEKGGETEESKDAQRLYHALDKLGYRTFFAPYTLESKAGQDFEPVIFTAINSAKIMFVIAYTAQHYNAVWVRNEWGRFLERKKNEDSSILLITCFNDLIAEAGEILPKELSSKESYNLRNGVNGLVEIVKKKIPKSNTTLASIPSINKELSNLNDVQAANLCKRGFDFLEDGDFNEAKRKFEESADKQADFSKPYWGLMLAELRCRNNDELVLRGKPINDDFNYKKAARNANSEEQKEYLAVINAITYKITQVNKALIKKRYSDILATGIKEEIEKSKKIRSENQSKYDKLIKELHDIEIELKKVVGRCIDLINPLDAESRDIDKKLRAFANNELENRNRKIPDNEYKSAIKKEIVPANNKLSDLTDKAKSIYEENEDYIKLRELINSHNNVIRNIQLQISQFNELEKNMNELNQNVKSKVDAYDQALNEIPLSYTVASRLLGDIYNKINSNLPQIPSLGASTIGSTTESSVSNSENVLYSEVPTKAKVISKPDPFVPTDNRICDIILMSSGMNKLDIIKYIRESNGLGLADAKNLTENTPKILKSGVPIYEARKIKNELEKMGAHVEIR